MKDKKNKVHTNINEHLRTITTDKILESVLRFQTRYDHNVRQLTKNFKSNTISTKNITTRTKKVT